MSLEIQPTNRVGVFFSLIKKSLRGDLHDYTQGNIRHAIILLAIPMILELGMESIFAVADMFFVGKLGENAIATVGLTESVVSIIYSMAIGLSTAATAMVARRIGEKNPEAAAHAGAQVILLAIVLSVLIGIVGVIFAPDILRIMGAQPEVIRTGAVFTRIMLGGNVVIMLLFLINGIFRGAGNPTIAMKSLWIGSGINILLCWLFVTGIGSWPGMGVKGAAIATTIGRGIGVLYQCYHLFYGKGVIKIKKSHFQFDPPLMRSLVKIAWPATLQFLITSGSWIVLAWLVAVSGGTPASAGYQIAIRNLVFFLLPAWGFSNAAATLVGQNLGAKEPGRAEKSVLLAAKYNAIFMVFVSAVFIFFSPPIIHIFTKDPAVTVIGIQALRIIGTGFIFYGVGMVLIQALNGAGDTKTPTWINFVCFWLLQVPLAWFLARGLDMGPKGAFISIPSAEIAISIAGWYFFRKGKWKKVEV
jgi:putative MATE family efflux protein